MRKEHLWWNYSKSFKKKIEDPKFIGEFLPEDGEAHSFRLSIGREGSVKDGALISFYALVDPEDGVIADIRYEAYGPSVLIGIAEVLLETIIHKNYHQASRVTPDLLDRKIRDSVEVEGFSKEILSYVQLTLSALEKITRACSDLPFAEGYTTSPIEAMIANQKEIPNWKELSKEQQIVILEQILTEEIRPYIELDAGGVKILDLIEGEILIIAYEGACTSCHSATGATLHAIEQILKAKVYHKLTVKPDLSFYQKE